MYIYIYTTIYIVWYDYVKHRGWSHHGLLFYPYKSWMFLSCTVAIWPLVTRPHFQRFDHRDLLHLWLWEMMAFAGTLWSFMEISESLRYRLYTFVWQVNWFLFCQNSATSSFQQTIIYGFFSEYLNYCNVKPRFINPGWWGVLLQWFQSNSPGLNFRWNSYPFGGVRLPFVGHEPSLFDVFF